MGIRVRIAILLCSHINHRHQRMSRLPLRPSGKAASQVAAAVLVHRPQDEVEIVARAFVVNEVVGLGDVQLAADDGPKTCLLRLGVELQRAVHGPVIGDSHGVHAVFFGLFNQVANADGTVEHGILRVDVQVGEALRHEKLCGDEMELQEILRTFLI